MGKKAEQYVPERKEYYELLRYRKKKFVGKSKKPEDP